LSQGFCFQNKESIVPRLPLLSLHILLGLLLCLSGCSDIPADRTYALWLDQAPTDSDWERALPRPVHVRGGRPHKLQTFTDIDEDTVHTSTASCHHGSRIPEPVPVDIRAFYTDQELFLRLSWEDATRDQSMFDWKFDGEAWQNTGQLEDGFGLLWDAKGQFNNFSCSYACHISDFGVSKANFHASNKMRMVQENSWLDLWNWKAARTALLGFADDRYLDFEGMHGDTPGEIFTENSKAHVNGGLDNKPFADGDAPVYDAERLPADEGFRPPGTLAPGYLVKRPVGGRADVSAVTRYENGRWIVTLRRALQTGDPRDVIFVPGDELGVAFGLALMDHSLYEHYASRTVERLVLLKP
jgi:hypothetical protein